MQVRRAGPGDAEAIRAIYNLEVTTTTVTFDLVERSPDEHTAWMSEHGGVYPVVVAIEDGAVVGFASLSPYRPRAAYATTAEDSVYVARGWRSRGIGRALLSEIILLAGRHGFHAVVARIVGDHEASIALHRSLGFELIGIEREIGRKFGRWLDVAVMELLVGRTALPPAASD